jgi:6-phosphofructokinase 1
MKKIAVLTSGGDAPGMNACIRSIVKSCLHVGIECIGIHDGFQGLIDRKSCSLGYNEVNNIIQRGGTILGTARSQEFRTAEGRQKAISYLKKLAVDGLIVIGGDGSFTGAKTLGEEFNLPIIGIPGTIDNDIYGTDHTIGYDTALNTVVDAVDKIRDTASSHHRIFFVEVMGRDSGFIALNTALASGAESVLIPEEMTDIPKLAANIKTKHKGKRGSIIIVAEGDDAGDAVTVMNKVKPYLPDYDLRCTILGHIQRGGNPSAYDRIIATRMGAKAVDLLQEGNTNKMVGVKGNDLVVLNIEDGIQKTNTPDLSQLQLIEQLRTKK